MTNTVKQTAVQQNLRTKSPLMLTGTEPPAHEAHEEAKPLTLEEVRAVLADKSKDGFTAQIRELLKKYGADRLSAIDPANYRALLTDAEGLKDAT